MVLSAKGVASRMSSGSLSEAKTSPLEVRESAKASTASPWIEQDQLDRPRQATADANAG